MIAWAKTLTLSSAPFSRYLPTRASGKHPEALDRVVAGCRIQGLAAGRRIIGVREKHLRQVGEGLVLELGCLERKGQIGMEYLDPDEAMSSVRDQTLQPGRKQRYSRRALVRAFA